MSHNKFLKKILANPHDVAPRLVYADWLNEQGDPRGEFIQLQIRRNECKFDDPEAVEARSREQQLLRKHGKAWAGPIAKITAKYRFRNGFVEQVDTALKTFLTRSDDIFSTAPISSLKLRQCNDDRIRELAHHNRLDQISWLDLSKCTMTAEGFSQLVSQTKLANLEVLTIHQTEFTVPMSTALARSSFGKSLRVLDIDAMNAITPSAVEVKPLIKAFPNLQHLDLVGCQLTLEDVALIAKSNLRQLKSLAVPGGDVGEEAIDAVLNSTKLKNLRWLSYVFANNPIRLAGPTKLKLERLDLSKAEVTNDDAIELFHSESLSNLKCLDLTYGRGLSSGCVKELVQSPLFATLDCLAFSVSKRKLSKSAFEKLVAAWKELERPPGSLCLPTLDLPPNVVKDLHKRYGNDSFVDLFDGGGLLRPGETFFETIHRWKND